MIDSNFVSSRMVLNCVLLLIGFLVLLYSFNFDRTNVYSRLNLWRSVGYNPLLTKNVSRHDSLIKSVVWSHEGTGIVKYVQWMVTRRLVNIRLTRLDRDCHSTHDNLFHTNSTDRTFIQVFLIPFSANLTDQSNCSKKITQAVYTNVGYINHIYFRRNSKRYAGISSMRFLTMDR